MVYNLSMSVISTPSADFCRLHFIFIEKNILVKKGADFSIPIDVSSLPDDDTVRLCIKNQIVSDWFSEQDKDYTALLLENGSPIPAGYTAIPLRQFFWDTKTDKQKLDASNTLLGGTAARAHGFLKLREKYRFCPTCGKPLTDDRKFTAKRCTSCDRLFFPQIEPAVIVLVSKGNQILLAKSKTVASTNYSCIAGFVELGETLEEAVEREVMEETGIKIKNIKYRGSQPWPFPDQLMLAYTADYDSGEIKIQEEEIEDARWFDKDSIPQIPSPGSVAFNLITGKFGD